MKNRFRSWVRMFATEADAGEVDNTGQGSAPSQRAPQEPGDAEDHEGGVDDREKMTELERAQPDLEKTNTRIAELEEATTVREREQLAGKILSDAKLPAEMADRLRGETGFRKRPTLRHPRKRGPRRSRAASWRGPSHP